MTHSWVRHSHCSTHFVKLLLGERAEANFMWSSTIIFSYFPRHLALSRNLLSRVCWAIFLNYVSNRWPTYERSVLTSKGQFTIWKIWIGGIRATLSLYISSHCFSVSSCCFQTIPWKNWFPFTYRDFPTEAMSIFYSKAYKHMSSYFDSCKSTGGKTEFTFTKNRIDKNNKKCENNLITKKSFFLRAW